METPATGACFVPAYCTNSGPGAGLENPSLIQVGSPSNIPDVTFLCVFKCLQPAVVLLAEMLSSSDVLICVKLRKIKN